MKSVEEKTTADIQQENKKIFLKSLFFVLSFYLLANGIVFAATSEWISVSGALLGFLGLVLVAAPTYFFLKSDVKNFKRYLLNMSAVHLSLFLLEFVILFVLEFVGFFKGIVSVAWFSASGVIFLSLGLILLLDLIYYFYYVLSKGK